MDSNSIPGSMSDQQLEKGHQITSEELEKALDGEKYEDVFNDVPGSMTLSEEKKEKIENMESKPETGVSQDDIDALLKGLPKK